MEDGKVTIKRRNDGRTFVLPLDKLSEADQAWVRENGVAEQAAAEKAAAQTGKSNPFAKLITGDWERHVSDGLEYRLFGERKFLRPASPSINAEPSQYPLVIYLHGKNGDVMKPDTPGSANKFAATKERDRRCFVLAPQAPKKDETWSGKNGVSVIEIAKDLIKHLPIDENRIYLTGYSMGAYGTFRLLGAEPKFFAAAVPIAGGGNPSAARDYKKVPIWIFHGAKDPTVKVEQSQKMVEALKKARADVQYTEFPEGDHGIAGKVYSDEKVHEWMFKQARK